MKLPNELSDEAEIESYEYFDKNIRAFPKKVDGSLDLNRAKLQHNDVDAFRHAYVSGVFTQEYGENGSRLAGWLNEKLNLSSQPGDENMDFWNNEVGIRLAKTHKTRRKLADAIKKALNNGDLITTPNDERVYEGAAIEHGNKMSVIVLNESKTGANQVFFDWLTSTGMSRKDFVVAIQAGKYPNYSIRKINGIEYPVSSRDEAETNNLG